jgi:hypothetical protein
VIIYIWSFLIKINKYFIGSRNKNEKFDAAGHNEFKYNKNIIQIKKLINIRI